ncbi:restriction endonuclease [Bifidobacterium callitrichos]|uniref:Restriction endonuclease n=1 Tax=Bifidobacterium callitrichos DSM 23973 TaxID=1437609 RepID=A0A086ZXR1_9BIFI|nr:restriction endonuclease [Bifidobacterium callitrichos]KFI51311.1 restriction endonuclease [Bifidobacterium callitrichos DSM 23973]
MAIPRYDEFFGPVLRFLSDGKVHGSGEMLAALADEFKVTEEERRQLLPSGGSRVLNGRIGWARTYLKKAGLMESPKRGAYRITEEGRKALVSGEPIDNEYLNRYESFRDFVSGDSGDGTSEPAPGSTRSGRTPDASSHMGSGKEEPSEETPDEALDRAFASISMRLADDLLTEVLKLSPVAFERFVLDLMAKMGYGAFDSANQMTPITGDEGIDGIIMEDKLGFDLIYVQAKRYAEDQTVGRPAIQAFVGAIAGRGGRGLFVTTAKFSRQAIDYAKLQHIILVDGHKLAQLMIEHDFGVSTRRTYEIKAVDSDIFNEYTDEE